MQNTNILNIKQKKNVTIEIILSHPSGNQISTEGTFPIDSTGSKNSIRSVGFTLTYGRYLLCMLLNVASKEDDTDGQPRTKEGDTNNQKVSSKQIKQIE